MRIHHLDCISMCPPGGRLMDGRTGAHGRARLTCHCLLLELPDRLVLVDTGFGMRDVHHPRERLAWLFRALLCRPQLRESDSALRQLQRRGFAADDVSDIVLTHLDFDHAGGLDDFPRARVHLLEAERMHASSQATWLSRRRFRPSQWASMPRWVTHVPRGDRWFDFEAVSELDGLPPEILMVPLPGHTMGHAGVAVRDAQDRWLLHAGDAYFFRGEMDPSEPRCTIGLRLYQWLMETDRGLRLANQRRLRDLVRRHGDEVRVFSAHDAVEFEYLRSERVAGVPPSEATTGVRRRVDIAAPADEDRRAR